MDFTQKYLKYKNKYIALKNKIYGGARIRCKVNGCTENHAMHHCRYCESNNSDHKSKNCPNKPSNTAVIFITPSNRVLLVRDIKNKHWMVPGGKRDGNEFSFDSAKREFREETSFVLDSNKITSNKKYLYRNNGKITIIYIIKSTQQFPAFDRTKTNNETDEVAYKRLDDIKNYLRRPVGVVGPVDPIISGIKFYNQESLKELMSKGLI